ncbi:MAG: Wzz/FepE/Etk N-terminal domain-containing protein [Gammaproteobacteria bacterium]|nr:Wzz/FepE/Etk N-terminal domain-containing protein [Gammaproteobacteria bacterium]
MRENNLDSSNMSENLQKMVPEKLYDSEQMHEMSLFDLAIILWSKRYWIVALTSIITIASFIYALSLTHVYKAEAVILPPSDADIGVLNVYTTEHKDDLITQTKVMSVVIKNFSSMENKWKFFNQNNLKRLYKNNQKNEVSDRDLFEEGFEPALGIDEPDKNSNKRVVYFESTDAQIASKVLNDYLSFIRDQTKSYLIKDIVSLVETRRNKMNIEIESLKRYAEYAKKDKIKLIEEQLSIARKLNIHENKLVKSGLPSGGYLGKIQPSKPDKQTVTTPMQDPSYLEGTRALQTALEVLINRKSNDSHVSGLRELQSELLVLEKTNIDKDKFHVFTIEQMASPPKSPFKPKKKLIVMLTFIAGILVSIILVVIWHFAAYVDAQMKRNA